MNSNMLAQEGPLAAGIRRYVHSVAEDAKSIRERMNAKILGGAEKGGQTMSDEQWPPTIHVQPVV